MRPLTDDETKAVFSKLAKFIGDNVRQLIDRTDEDYVFRLHHDRVYYCSEKLMKQALCIPRKQLLGFGTCLGKFTKSKKFRLHVTCLQLIAPHAKYRVWLKSGGEQSFLYGNHVLKSGVGRITENTPTNQGVLIYSMNDLPLGFGVTAKSTQLLRHAQPTSIAVLRLADIGEYIRHEHSLT